MHKLRQMQQRGWFFLVRDDKVFCFNKEPKLNVLTMPVANGAWMEQVDNPPAWSTIQTTPMQFLNFTLTAKHCYCRSLPDGLCDFCSGTRKPPTPNA